MNFTRKLTKFHFLQCQKWPKINFWTGKKFETAKNAISWKKIDLFDFTSIMPGLFFRFCGPLWKTKTQVSGTRDPSLVENMYKKNQLIFLTFSVIVTSLEWNIVEHIHALIETRPYKIQTFRIGASGCIFFRNLLSSCTWAIKLNIEKIAAAGSCIPKNRINGHFPWNWGVLR